MLKKKQQESSFQKVNKKTNVKINQIKQNTYTQNTHTRTRTNTRTQIHVLKKKKKTNLHKTENMNK